jgi:hypothetical protein
VPTDVPAGNYGSNVLPTAAPVGNYNAPQDYQTAAPVPTEDCEELPTSAPLEDCDEATTPAGSAPTLPVESSYPTDTVVPTAQPVAPGYGSTSAPVLSGANSNAQVAVAALFAAIALF